MDRTAAAPSPAAAAAAASSYKDVEKGEAVRVVPASTASGPDLKRTASKGSFGIAVPSRVSLWI